MTAVAEHGSVRRPWAECVGANQSVLKPDDGRLAVGERCIDGKMKLLISGDIVGSTSSG